MKKATESVAFSKKFLAEGVGIEPTHGCYPVYGLAIRCITILPALRRRLSFYRKIAPPSTLKRIGGEIIRISRVATTLRTSAKKRVPLR